MNRCGSYALGMATPFRRQWTDYDSDSEYDAFEFVEELRRNRAVREQEPVWRKERSSRLASREAREYKHGCLRLTWINLTAGLAELLFADPRPLTRRVHKYARVVARHVLLARYRFPRREITECEVQLVVDCLRTPFPIGIVIQTPPFDEYYVEAVRYTPSSPPSWKIVAPAYAMPLFIVRDDLILSAEWLTPAARAPSIPQFSSQQEEFKRSVTYVPRQWLALRCSR